MIKCPPNQHDIRFDRTAAFACNQQSSIKHVIGRMYISKPGWYSTVVVQERVIEASNSVDEVINEMIEDQLPSTEEAMNRVFSCNDASLPSTEEAMVPIEYEGKNNTDENNGSSLIQIVSTSTKNNP